MKVIKSERISQCERLVKAFNEQKIDEYPLDILVRVFYFEETVSFYPTVCAGTDLNSEETLLDDLKYLNLEPSGKYNPNDAVIVITEAPENDEECYQDLRLLLERIYSLYCDFIMVGKTEEEKKADEELLSRMKQNIFTQVYCIG